MATRKSELVLTCNATALKDVMKFLNKEMDELIKKRDALLTKGEQNWSDRERNQFKRWGDDIAAITSMIQKNRQEMVKYADVMKDLSQAKLRDLKRALNEGKRALDKMSESSHGRKQLIEGLQKIQRQMDIIGEKSQSLAKVTKQLENLVNVPTEKLRVGLEAIRKEMEKEPEGTQWSNYLKNAEKRYAAQISVNELGRAGNVPLTSLTDEQLRAEQSRLRSLYMSTQGAAGFEGISNDALTRLQQANKLIKDRADAEREAAKAARESELAEQRRLEFAQQGQQTHRTLANMEKASYEDLENALKHLEEQRKKYIQSGDTKHIQRNLQMQDKLKQKQAELQKMMLSDQQISDRVNNSKKYNIIQLQQAYDQLKYKLSTLNTEEVKAIKETRKQMQSLEKTIKGVQGEVTGLQKIWQTAVRNIATYMGVFAIAGFAKNKIQSLVKDNLALSDSMAQVQKVTGLTSEEVKKLNVNLGKMDTRTGIEQLNELAFTAGKMGIGKYGLEGIQGFVKAANELQVALGDDLGSSVEESILPLAKLGENLGLFEKLGTEKAMKAIGSSINELSQTTTAAGRNIVDFARRIQPAAQMIGLTTDEILALGSASDSFGVSSEISATAFTKFLAAYRTNTAEIEKILNILPGTLDKFFDEGKTMEGLLTIFQRMHEIGDLRYLKDAFDALGSEGSRMFTTFGAFSKNIDMFREHLATSTKAFDEATSVTREYNLVQETAQGIIERSNNIWKNAFVNPDGVDMVKQLADEWYRLSKELTESKTWMTSAKVSLGMLLEAVKLLIEALPTLIRLAGAYGLGLVLQGLVQNFNAIYRAVTLANTGVARFNLLLKTNAIAMGMTLIAYVVSKFIDMSAAADKATESVEENTAAMERSQRATQTYTSTMASNYATLMEKYDQLKRQWKALKTEHEKNEWIKKNKSAFEELGLSVTNAASAEEVFEKNTARVVEGFKRRAEAAALAAQMTEYYRQKMDIENEAQQVINEKGKEAGDRVYKQPAVMQRDKNANTFNNGQFILGRDGNYYYTSQGAEQYNRELLKQKQSEYDSVDKQIDDAAKRMENLGKTPATTNVTPKGGDNGGTDDKSKKLKDDFDKTKKQVEGLIAKIDEWYNLQEAAVKDAEATGEMTKKEADDLVQAMEIARNDSLMRARKAVGSGEQQAIDDWTRWAKTVLPSMLADSSEWSRNLMNSIQEVDAKALHDFLATLKEQTDDPKVMAMLDASSFFDTMMKKGAESKKKAEVLRAKFKETLDSYVKQYDVIIRAQDKMRDDLQSLGIMTETPEQMAARLANGEAAPDDRQQYAQMGGKFIGMNTIPYTIDVTNKDDALYFIEQLTHDSEGAMEQWAQAFPKLMEWVNLYQQNAVEGEHLGDAEKKAIEEAMPQIQALYYQLMNFSDGVSVNIKKQVEQMTNRNPIGIDEMKSQHEQRVSLTTSLYDQKINEANENGDVAQAVELEEQKKQALIDLEYQFQNEMYQIREQMGTTWYEQYEKEVAMYKNMLDKKLISEREFQKKKKELDINLGLKNAQYFNGLMSNMVNALQEAEIASVEAKYDAEINAAKAAGQDTTALEEQKEAEIFEIRKKYAGMQLAVKISEIIANTAVAIMMAYAQLGPIAGNVAAAMLGVTGAAQLALAIAEYNKVMSASAGGSSKASSTGNATKTKLVSGMLTYDKGNVQRFIGQDGKVYTATAEPAPKDGLVTHPIATTVQGQPALVAENGPEIVIGRETTKAIMMNEPELIRYLANYQQQGARRLFDSGNVDSVQSAGVLASDTAATERQALINRLDRSDALMEQVLYFLQNPVAPEIAMYDTGGKPGLHTKIKQADKFMARYGG